VDVELFNELPILGILRGIGADAVETLTESIVSSGLKTVEITMNTDDAPYLIRKMAGAADNRFAIGAGTVLSMDDLRSALDAGASFIVLPVMISDVVEYCANHSIPVFPGAFTPQEIYTAWSAGATMVKVFPAKFFGPDYFREIRGPFGEIKLLACGGITSDSIGSFFSSGASAVAFGGSIFRKEWLHSRKFSLIEMAIKELISRYTTQASSSKETS
jgi:2-dehydro-3-deoxyphosphogluconate aldolase/(4S)-4-hydroxy-2-oxoglutarate aldolase